MLAATVWAVTANGLGCSGHLNEVPNMPQQLTAEAERCKLEVQAVLESPTLMKLTYVFSNGNSRNAYLFNRLYRGINAQGAYQTSRDLVYVEAEKEKATISKKIVPVPPLVSVEKPEIPCATCVRPGERFTETLSVPLPLVPYTPYLEPPSQAAKGTMQCRVWFEIGFFIVGEGGDALAKKVPTTEGEALYFDPFPASSQRLLRIGPVLEGVPVQQAQ
jgi:hypothetical protein